MPTGLAVGLAATANRRLADGDSSRGRYGRAWCAPGARFAPGRLRNCHPAVGPPFAPAPGRVDSAGRFRSRRGSQLLEPICVSLVTPRSRGRISAWPTTTASRGSTAPSCTSSATRRTCTWPAAWCSRASRPPTTSWSNRSPSGCTWYRAIASASRSCPSTRGGRYGSTIRTSTSPSTCATRRCPAPAETPSSSGWPGACSPRRWTGPGRCGRSGSSRACATGGSPCCPRPTMRSWTGCRASTSPRCCSTPRRTRCRSPRPRTSGSPGRCPAAPSSWPMP